MCCFDLSIPVETVEGWKKALERKKQAVLYGPPGTGKTFVAEALARHLISATDGFWKLVQFHPAYTYEDFIQGIRPVMASGGLDYPTVPGRFVEFCEQARRRSGPCVLIIDEINRANLARVFGELLYLLEYRDREVNLSVDGSPFRIPSNVRLIGTMNTADRSIALVDHALRRRFAFIHLKPDYEALRRWHARNTGFDVEPLITQLKKLNRAIGDQNYEIGGSFFFLENPNDTLESVWRMEIEPYLEEFFFDNLNRMTEFRWSAIGSSVLG